MNREKSGKPGLLDRLSPRELVLGAITVLLLLSFLFYRHYLLPAHDQWQSSRNLLRLRVAEHAKLKGYLTIRDEVGDELRRLESDVQQAETDEITIANFLRDMEALPRDPGLVFRMNVLPVSPEPAHKVYRFRISVSGKLPELLRFVTNLTHGPAVTGLESFNLRGVAGHNMVECGLMLRMIKFVAGKE